MSIWFDPLPPRRETSKVTCQIDLCLCAPLPFLTSLASAGEVRECLNWRGEMSVKRIPSHTDLLRIQVPESYSFWLCGDIVPSQSLGFKIDNSFNRMPQRDHPKSLADTNCREHAFEGDHTLNKKIAPYQQVVQSHTENSRTAPAKLRGSQISTSAAAYYHESQQQKGKYNCMKESSFQSWIAASKSTSGVLPASLPVEVWHLPSVPVRLLQKGFDPKTDAFYIWRKTC